MTSDPLTLYEYADAHGIAVTWFDFDRATSLSVSLPDGSCCIALDPWKLGTVAEETVCLAHELGHCETGSFYTPCSPLALRSRMENRADRWAVEHLISPEALEAAFRAGCTEAWQLAEHFGVTEAFIRKAVSLYRHGNLDSC